MVNINSNGEPIGSPVTDLTPQTQMHYARHDMQGRYYYWSENSIQSQYSGPPSRRLFDRYNGDQVLYIINFYASIRDKFTKEDGKMIEKEISENLPLDARSEISVYNWIVNQSTHDIRRN